MQLARCFRFTVSPASGLIPAIIIDLIELRFVFNGHDTQRSLLCHLHHLLVGRFIVCWLWQPLAACGSSRHCPFAQPEACRIVSMRLVTQSLKWLRCLRFPVCLLLYQFGDILQPGAPVSLTVVKQFGSTGALRIFRLCTARSRSFILVRALEVLFSYTSCLNDSPLLSDNHRVPMWQTHLGLRNYALMMFVVLMTTCFVSAAF